MYLSFNYLFYNEKVGRFELSSNIDDWGISLSVDNVTPTGLTLVCKQEDFIPTTLNDDWQFSTDSYFRIEKLKGQRWKSASLIRDVSIQKGVEGSFEVQNINTNGSTTLEFNWGKSYGKLSKGEYCLEQKIKVLKGPNDYDWRTVWIPFTVE